ncbi:MAG: hypothetical protein H6721_30790 [Sandaracinus sp.]|nr:hypothetical protein [Sandaracinus sp.]MCB9618141.1 hypothetical protein [Sandaracinus sp.]MCB9624142.1 hypothetical protein [Sandaracinus sp.]MCB9636519.1 hypothetical protein [Sandaracinus sp.]
MKTNAHLTLLALALLVSPTSPTNPVRTASAQGPMRRALPTGERSGLELGIEGPLTVQPGQTARWILVAHEVIRDRDLRPAAGARLEAFASYDPAHAVAEVRTDARGRAVVDVPIPRDLPSGFELAIDLRSDGARLSRRFRVQVQVARSTPLRLVALRNEVRRGDRVPMLAHLTDSAGRPMADTPVSFRSWGERGPLGEPWIERTDALGRAVAFVRARENRTVVRATVVLDDERTLEAAAGFVATASEPRTLVLRAVPRHLVAAPSTEVEVDVQVRDARGLPIAGAEIRGPALTSDDEPERATTDARGRATLLVRTPATEGEHTTRFEVVVPGLSRSNVSSSIRVTRGTPVVRARIEGGALLPGLPSKVWLRVVGPDGAPVRGPLTLMLGDQSVEGSTDEAGVATVELTTPLARGTLEAPDGCGGGTAIEAQVRVGTHRERLCLPSDPDGVVRVRTELRDGQLEVGVRRRADVSRAPVVLTASVWRPGGLVPIRSAVLDPGQDTLRWPAEHESLVIRARALVTEGLVEVRGSTAVFDPTRDLRVGLEGDTVVGTRPLIAVAWPGDATPPRLAPTTPAARAADQAARAPFDDAAPAVWRDGEAFFLPPPEEPVTRGVLRDPWRQRALYRTGRLALVLRAIEEEVDVASGSGELTDVAHRVNGRWQMNRALLERAVSGQPVGAEGARDLGGLPLTLDDLSRADRSLTYDHVAARITRARLLRVLVALRGLVQERGLDLVFARRGDVSTWLLALLEEGRVEETDLRDGWGTPLALVPMRQPRFSLFVPVTGFELVAAGPDQAVGTRDDLWDPLARVLPSGGLYAEAVDEDGLLLRLRGVSLAHATMAELATIYETEASEAGVSATSLAGWDDVPTPPTTPPIDARLEARHTYAGLLVPGASLDTLELPSTPARYRVVLYDGETPVAYRTHTRGRAAAFVGELPRRLPESPLRVALPFVAFGDLEGLRVEVEAEGADVRVVEGPSAMEAGLLGTWQADVRATRSGSMVVRLLDAAGREHARHTSRFTTVTTSATRDRRTAAVIAANRTWTLDPEIPSDAVAVHGELVALAPRRWHRDPALERALGSRPSLLVWAEVLGGGAPNDATRDVMNRMTGLRPLEQACQSLVTAALDMSVTPLPAATGDVRVDATLLAALSPAAPPPWQVRDDVFERLRRTLRDASVTHADDLPALARAAAALLLTDGRDESGHAILARARALVDEATIEDPRDEVGTFAALAIALHRAGEVEEAHATLAAHARRAWLVFDAPDLDGTFWWVAASAFGVAGDSAELVGTPFDAEGVARREITSPTELRTTGSGLVLARFAARYERPVQDVEGPFTLGLEGHGGRLGRPAALEITIEANEASTSPRLLVRLPPAARIDAAARAALAGTPGVTSIEPARNGALLVHLGPMASGEVRRLPLRLRWLAAGRRPGVGLAAWDATTPWRASSRAARERVIE